MKHVFFNSTLGAAALMLLTFQASAQAQNCAMRDKVLDRLTGEYGETRQSIGLAPNNSVIEVFASSDTGTWTILVTEANGRSCLLASGQAFEEMAEVKVAKGEDA